MRLDKLLAHMGLGSRKEVKKMVADGLIAVNHETETKANRHVDPDEDEITYLGNPIHYQEFYYVMLNKPAGLLSATEDLYTETVVDWVALDYAHVDLFPVGRLDIDTTGLLLLTNHGKLAHRLLSPRQGIPKVYRALVAGKMDEKDQRAFEEGLDLEDFTTAPAKLELLAYDEALDQTQVEITITEGKFHQVKRMVAKVGKEVLELERLSMGPLTLDPQLELGAYRELTEEEMDLLRPYGLE